MADTDERKCIERLALSISLCNSIISRTTYSAASIASIVSFAEADDAAASSETLRSHRELLTKLSSEALGLEKALSKALIVSESLQEALKSVLTTGDEAIGKMHKQLMRVQLENVYLIDEGSKRAEQDTFLMIRGQSKLQHVEKAQLKASQALEADDLPSGEQPPPYAAADTSSGSSSCNAEAGPSKGNSFSGTFAFLTKSVEAFTSHFQYKPDPLVSALCQAVLHGDVQQVGGLLAEGANVNGRNEQGHAAMYCAIISDNENVIPLLLAAGASFKGSGRSGLPPLFQAASLGRLRSAKVLLENGANVMEQNNTGQPYFVDMCNSGNFQGIEFLLQHGAKATSESMAGHPVLIQAVKKDNFELVKLLLKFGANASSSDISGSSALALAIEKKDKAMATLLLDSGARPDCTNVYGRSILANAISKRRLDVANLLLEHGAKGSEADIHGQSLLTVVIKDTKMSNNDKTDLIRGLLRNGANANESDSWGNLPLFHALESTSCPVAIVNLLMCYGAKRNKSKISNGETRLLYTMDRTNRM